MLPAETVAAVSTGLAQLGKPFVTAGRTRHLRLRRVDLRRLAAAGYAVPSPRPASGPPAPGPAGQLQVGDLVFSPGGQDVGLYLGGSDVVGASADRYQVGVRAGRPDPGRPGHDAGAATPTAALPLGGHRPQRAALPAPGGPDPRGAASPTARSPATRCAPSASPAPAALRRSRLLRRDEGGVQMTFGSRCASPTRTGRYGSQAAAHERKPSLAAIPGTSNHGSALAVDLCGGINVAEAQRAWMRPTPPATDGSTRMGHPGQREA